MVDVRQPGIAEQLFAISRIAGAMGEQPPGGVDIGIGSGFPTVGQTPTVPPGAQPGALELFVDQLRRGNLLGTGPGVAQPGVAAPPAAPSPFGGMPEATTGAVPPVSPAVPPATAIPQSDIPSGTGAQPGGPALDQGSALGRFLEFLKPPGLGAITPSGPGGTFGIKEPLLDLRISPPQAPPARDEELISDAEGGVRNATGTSVAQAQEPAETGGVPGIPGPQVVTPGSGAPLPRPSDPANRMAQALGIPQLFGSSPSAGAIPPQGQPGAPGSPEAQEPAEVGIDAMQKIASVASTPEGRQGLARRAAARGIRPPATPQQARDVAAVERGAKKKKALSGVKQPKGPAKPNLSGLPGVPLGRGGGGGGSVLAALLRAPQAGPGQARTLAQLLSGR